MKHTSLILALVFFSFHQGLWAAGDANAGKEKAQMCAACHGADGNAIAPIYPHLAGQYRDYLVKAMKDYKSGARKDPIMTAMVAGLSDDDVENLAAFFSKQPGKLKVAKD